MAHFVLTVDSNPDHRNHFIRGARLALGSLAGLEIHDAGFEDLAVVWACGSAAPRSHHSDRSGLGLLLGYAVDDEGRWVDSGTVQQQWTAPPARHAAFGGYFVAVAFSTTGGLVAGADLLGFFPVYYAQLGSAVVVSSSIELLKAHPDFQYRPDLHGLAGILLSNGLLNQRTLCSGVKRLSPGCQLRCIPGGAPEEHESFRLRATEPAGSCSPDEVREQGHAELLRAIQWHRPRSGNSVLMLSGGLDSRLMAGYLHAGGIIDTAVCLGQSTDLEVQVGSRVTAALGLRLHREPREPSTAEFLQAARRTARWEHLASGFSHLEAEATANVLGQVAPMFWSGFALEDAMAAAARTMALNDKTGEWSYARFLRSLNHWGIPPDTLRRLLPQAAQAIEQQLNGFHGEYEREPELQWQRAVRAKFATRVRFHVGGVIHRMAFRCWPLLPVLDARLLQVHFNVPAQLLVGRRLQKDLLNRHFPQLARIPREHNTYRLEPLRPSRLQETAAVVGGKFRRWYWRHWRKSDPRRYVRYYDLNGPLWRAVRDAAEEHRVHLNGCMDRRTFDELLPSPHENFALRDPFSQGASARLLLGYLLAQDG